MSDFRDTQIKAALEGILMDTCGMDTRDYHWGLYTDLCGMSYEDAINVTKMPGNVAIGQLIVNKCGCDCNCGCGDKPTQPDNPTTVENEVIFALSNEGKLVLKFKNPTEGNVKLNFNFNGSPINVNVPDNSTSLVVEDCVSDDIKYASISDITYSTDSSNYKYTLTNNVKDGMFTLTIVNNGVSSSKKLKYNAVITLPAVEPKTGYVGSWPDGVDGELMGEADRKVVSVYTKKKYNVTFNFVGYEDEIAPIKTEVEFGDKISEPTDIKKEGYTYSWADNVTFPMNVDDTVDAYEFLCTYEIQKFFLTIVAQFNKDKENVVISKTEYDYNSTIDTDYLNTEYEGYKLVSWENQIDTMPANEHTITGNYELKTYKVQIPQVEGVTVSLMDNDGNEVVPDENGNVTIEWGHDVTVNVKADENTYITSDGDVKDAIAGEDVYGNESLPTEIEYVIDSKPEEYPEEDNVIVNEIETGKYFTIDINSDDVAVETPEYSIVPVKDDYTEDDTYNVTILPKEGYNTIVTVKIGDEVVEGMYDAEENVLKIPFNTEGIENGVSVEISEEIKTFNVIVNGEENTVEYGGSYTISLDKVDGQVYDADSIKIDSDDENTNIVFNPTEVETINGNDFVVAGELVISNIVGNVDINTEDVILPIFTITYDLENMVSYNNEELPERIVKGDSLYIKIAKEEGYSVLNLISLTMGNENQTITEDVNEDYYTIGIEGVTDNVEIVAKAEKKKYQMQVVLVDDAFDEGVGVEFNADAEMIESGSTYTTSVTSKDGYALNFPYIKFNDENITDFSNIISSVDYLDEDGVLHENVPYAEVVNVDIFAKRVDFKYENVNSNFTITVDSSRYYRVEYELDGLNNDFNKVIVSDGFDIIVSGNEENVPMLVNVNDAEVWKRNDADCYGENIPTNTDSIHVDANSDIVIKAVASPVYTLSITASDLIDDYKIVIGEDEFTSVKAVKDVEYTGSIEYVEEKASVQIFKNNEEVEGIGGIVDGDIEYRVDAQIKQYELTVALKAVDVDDTPLGETRSVTANYDYGTAIRDIVEAAKNQMVNDIKDEYQDKEFKDAILETVIPETITENITIKFTLKEKEPFIPSKTVYYGMVLENDVDSVDASVLNSFEGEEMKDAEYTFTIPGDETLKGYYDTLNEMESTLVERADEEGCDITDLEEYAELEALDNTIQAYVNSHKYVALLIVPTNVFKDYDIKIGNAMAELPKTVENNGDFQYVKVQETAYTAKSKDAKFTLKITFKTNE